MSYLDADDKERMGTMLEEGTPTEIHEEPVETSSEEAPEVKQEPQESDAEISEPKAQVGAATTTEAVETTTEPAGMADTGDVGEGGEGSHRVPYNRFKQVIDARNQLRNERDILTRQVEEMSKRAEAFNAPGEQAPQYQEAEPAREYQAGLEAPDFLSEEEVEYFSAIQQQSSQRYEGLETRLHAYEMSMAEQQLETQIGQAVEKYPDVPRRAILEAVAGGNTNVMDVAERYSSFVAQMREAAIADYLSGQPKGAQAQVAPRPAKAAGSTVGNYASSPEERPKNLKDAHRALSKFLKTNNIF